MASKPAPTCRRIAPVDRHFCHCGLLTREAHIHDRRAYCESCCPVCAPKELPSRKSESTPKREMPIPGPERGLGAIVGGGVVQGAREMQRPRIRRPRAK